MYSRREIKSRWEIKIYIPYVVTRIYIGKSSGMNDKEPHIICDDTYLYQEMKCKELRIIRIYIRRSGGMDNKELHIICDNMYLYQEIKWNGQQRTTYHTYLYQEVKWNGQQRTTYHM